MGSVGAGRVVIIGGGPAGLGAGLGACRGGAREVLVLERSRDPGERRRGETLRHDADVEGLLEPGFFDRHTRHRVCKRRYYSPTGRRWVDREIANPNRIICWPDLLTDLAALARRAGARLLLETEAVGLRLGADGVEAVDWRDQRGAAGSLAADCVVAADGHAGLIASLLGQDRQEIDFPVRKLLLRGDGWPEDRFDYHLHVGPPGVAMVGSFFPRGQEEAELLITGWLSRQARRDEQARSLLQAELRSFTQAHPLLDARLQGAEIVYEAETWIPMGGLLTPLVPLPRLLIAGDLAGQVQPRGGSGIVCGIGLGHHAGKLAAATARRGGAFDQRVQQALEHALADHPLQRQLVRQGLLLGRPRQELLAGAASPAGFDRIWPLVRNLLR